MELFIILFLACFFFLLYMIKEAFANRVINTELLFPEFPKSFGEVKIFFISDIHRRSVSEKIISQVKGRADFAIIGGDLMEKGVSFEKVKANLSKLRQIGPVFFVWGNNDYEIDYHQLDAILLENSVKILDNTTVVFESEEGEKFFLMGIDDMNQRRDRLDLPLSEAEKDGFKILVSHNPRITAKIRTEHRIHLVLSGHTHGGQIHVFGYGPYEKGKVKKLKQTTVLISNGYGTTLLPLRLGAKSETHLITLKNG
ncbi:metallophosphoesterase [Bacillus methanolicus]|uniref:metallophosphoesterase n=1 Tax=Bacillus methanolicus TaxID=1471 RepID=UPI00238080FF|nr:metallophosphoesterase [Bacillus methanolicus]MDE3839431.1 metallophosphoesterase [Bacillus methanolicus]